MFALLSKPWAVAWLSISEWALLFFGIILVVGLVGEYFSDHKKREYPKFKNHKRLFEILVIVGVAGELFADGGIFLFSGRLQTISDHEVATSNERAGNAEREAKEADLLAAQIGITNSQLSLRVEELRSNNLAFSLIVEGLHSNNLVVNKRITDEANNAHKAASEANVRAALIESNNYALSITVEDLHSNNILTERQVEELRKQNLQLETRMVSGLYARTYLDVFSINDAKHVTVQRSVGKTRVFFLLSRVPVPISIYATEIWHTGFFRGFLGLFVGSDYGRSAPIFLGYNKNIVYADMQAPEWDVLEYPKDAKFVIRYTEMVQETNLWKKIEVKGKDVYFDNVKQGLQ